VRVIKTELDGVVIIEPRVFEDSRGSLFESYQAERYAAAGLPERFVQDNQSHSIVGTIRGLHYQLRHPQAKLVRVIRGSVIDVAVDIRRGSPTFRHWVAVERPTSGSCSFPKGLPTGSAFRWSRATSNTSAPRITCRTTSMESSGTILHWRSRGRLPSRTSPRRTGCTSP